MRGRRPGAEACGEGGAGATVCGERGGVSGGQCERETGPRPEGGERGYVVSELVLGGQGHVCARPGEEGAETPGLDAWSPGRETAERRGGTGPRWAWERGAEVPGQGARLAGRESRATRERGAEVPGQGARLAGRESRAARERGAEAPGQGARLAGRESGATRERGAEAPGQGHAVPGYRSHHTLRLKQSLHRPHNVPLQLPRCTAASVSVLRRYVTSGAQLPQSPSCVAASTRAHSCLSLREETGRQTDRQTDRQTHTHTHTHTAS